MHSLPTFFVCTPGSISLDGAPAGGRSQRVRATERGSVPGRDAYERRHDLLVGRRRPTGQQHGDGGDAGHGFRYHEHTDVLCGSRIGRVPFVSYQELCAAIVIKPVPLYMVGCHRGDCRATRHDYRCAHQRRHDVLLPYRCGLNALPSPSFRSLFGFHAAGLSRPGRPGNPVLRGSSPGRS